VRKPPHPTLDTHAEIQRAESQSLRRLFPGFDGEIWRRQMASWYQAARRAVEDSRVGTTKTLELAEVSTEFLDCLNNHSTELTNTARQFFSSTAAMRAEARRVGSFNVARLSRYHVALAATSDTGELIWFWIGAGEAWTDWSRLRADALVLAAGLTVFIVSVVASARSGSGEWLERSGAILTLTGTWLAYQSLSRHYNKARKSVHRGYWLATSRGQQLMDRMSIGVLMAGTLVWGYGSRMFAALMASLRW
jgi:hypothetical protein